MLFFEVFYNGHGLHDVRAIWEHDCRGGVLSHASGGVIGFDADGCELVFEIWVLNPFCGVGNAFIVEGEANCETSARMGRIVKVG